MSISFLKRASSISFTTRPLPPTFASGPSSILSPVVFIFCIVTVMPACRASSSAFTCSACHTASLLPRLPILISFIRQSPYSYPSYNCIRQPFNRCYLFRREGSQFVCYPFQLLPPYILNLFPEGDNGRHDL